MSSQDRLNQIPVSARTDTFVRPVASSIFPRVRFLFFRHGSAIVTDVSGERPVTAGDIIVLSPDMALGGCPEGSVTITTVFADEAFLVDQAYWRYAGLAANPLHMAEILSARFPESIYVIKSDEERMGLIAPCLDSLVEWTIAGSPMVQFYRMERNIASILNALNPHFRLLSDEQAGPAYSRGSVNSSKKRFRQTRREALTMRGLLDADISAQWTLAALAEHVHLSAVQASRIFVANYGVTPLVYQANLRVREMARLLRTTDLSVGEIERNVGWVDRSHASKIFQRYTGTTPRQYRRQLDTPLTRGLNHHL